MATSTLERTAIIHPSYEASLGTIRVPPSALRSLPLEQSPWGAYHASSLGCVIWTPESLPAPVPTRRRRRRWWLIPRCLNSWNWSHCAKNGMKEYALRPERSPPCAEYEVKAHALWNMRIWGFARELQNPSECSARKMNMSTWEHILLIIFTSFCRLAKATPVDHVRRGLEPPLLCLCTVLAYCRANYHDEIACLWGRSAWLIPPRVAVALDVPARDPPWDLDSRLGAVCFAARGRPPSAVAPSGSFSQYTRSSGWKVAGSLYCIPRVLSSHSLPWMSLDILGTSPTEVARSIHRKQWWMPVLKYELSLNLHGGRVVGVLLAFRY